MLNIFFDRLIDKVKYGRIPNGVLPEMEDLYVPELDLSKFRERYDINTWPAIYSGDLYQGNKYADVANICKVDNDVAVGIYPIEPFGSIDRCLGIDPSWNKKFGTKTAFDYISEVSKKHLRSGKLTLVISFLQESMADDYSFKVIHKLIKKFKFKKVLICVNDYLLKKRYTEWCIVKGHSPRFDVMFYSHSLYEKSEEIFSISVSIETGTMNISSKYKKHKHSILSLNDFNDSRTHIRKNKFLSFNRRLRSHRLAILLFFYKNSLLQNNSISFNFSIEGEEYNQSISDVVFKNEEKTYMKCFDGLYNLESQVVDYPISLKVEDGVHHGYGFENKEPYVNSYLSVVTETNFSGTTGYVSEKTWKPIGFFHPLIVIGNPHSLDILRDFGFKTFAPWINEDYDKEENHKKRFKMITEEILRINKMNLNEIHNWYWEMEDILVHNYKLFLDYGENKHSFHRKFLMKLEKYIKSHE